MKTVLYIFIIIGSLLLPIDKADVAKLQPVEAVALCKKDGITEIFTDTGAWGSGNNAGEALADMLKNTPQLIYLDTADYLMVNEEAIEELNELRKDLKGGIRLCQWDCEGELQDAIEYFSAHGNLPKLKNWKPEESLPKYFVEIT